MRYDPLKYDPLCPLPAAIFHTKNCRTKNLWVKIPKPLR